MTSAEDPVNHGPGWDVPTEPLTILVAAAAGPVVTA
jgi:hypothetical protein